MQALYDLAAPGGVAPTTETNPNDPHAPAWDGPQLLEVDTTERRGRGRWWGPDSAGYTDQLDRAGLYAPNGTEVHDHLRDHPTGDTHTKVVDGRVIVGPAARLLSMLREVDGHCDDDGQLLQLLDPDDKQAHLLAGQYLSMRDAAALGNAVAELTGQSVNELLVAIAVADMPQGVESGRDFLRSINPKLPLICMVEQCLNRLQDQLDDPSSEVIRNMVEALATVSAAISEAAMASVQSVLRDELDKATPQELRQLAANIESHGAQATPEQQPTLGPGGSLEGQSSDKVRACAAALVDNATECPDPVHGYRVSQSDMVALAESLATPIMLEVTKQQTIPADSVHDAAVALLANAEVHPDPRMKGTTDAYLVPLYDVDALARAVMQAKPQDHLRRLQLVAHHAAAVWSRSSDEGLIRHGSAAMDALAGALNDLEDGDKPELIRMTVDAAGSLLVGPQKDELDRKDCVVLTGDRGSLRGVGDHLYSDVLVVRL